MNAKFEPSEVTFLRLMPCTAHLSKMYISNELKKNCETPQSPHSLCCDLGGCKTFTTPWSGGKPEFESKFEPLPVIWQSLRRLFQKAIGGLESKALLAQVGRASTNTGRFGVCGSRCGQRQARLRKHATTLAIRTQFKSQQGFNAL